jgi:hypothetical protein
MKYARALLTAATLAALTVIAVADNYGSVSGGKAAPQSGMSGGICMTAPILLSNGEQAGLPIDCGTHALIVEGIISTGIPNVRVITTGTTDHATNGDFYSIAGHAILWNSASAGNKTEYLPPCVSGNSGWIGSIVDEYGNAATYPITLQPSSGNTINNQVSLIISTINQSVTLQCNGSGNWVTI